jgi:hypothetical protein
MVQVGLMRGLVLLVVAAGAAEELQAALQPHIPEVREGYTAQAAARQEIMPRAALAALVQFALSGPELQEHSHQHA